MKKKRSKGLPKRKNPVRKARLLREAYKAIDILPNEHMMVQFQKKAILANIEGDFTMDDYKSFMESIKKRAKKAGDKFINETKGMSNWDKQVLWNERLKKVGLM